MLRRVLRPLTVLTAVALLATAATAADFDIVHLRSGGVERGEITSVSKTEVTMQALVGTKKEEKKIPSNEIASVEWKAEPIQLQLQRSTERAGQLQKALDGYRKIQGDVTDANVKAEVAFLIARTQGKMALADPKRQDEAVKALDAFLTQNGNNFHYYEALALLGDLYLAQQNYDKARQSYDQLAQAPAVGHQMQAKTALGRLALAQGNNDEALTQFNAVLQMPAKSATEQGRRFDALLGKATALRAQNKPAEATQVIDEVIEQTSAENARTLAEAYNLKGDSLEAEGKAKDALLAYLHVDILFPGEAAQHAKALAHIAQLWDKENRPDRAGDARAKLRQLYPNSREAREMFGDAATK